MVGWCRGGGIGWLLDLIEEHRPALEYDWRTRFGLPLTCVGGDAMTFGEACRMVDQLARDPSSRTAASLAGWDHPWTWEAAVLADLFDVTAAAWSSKPGKPYPRPWPRSGGERHRPDVSGMTREQVVAALARMRGGGADVG